MKKLLLSAFAATALLASCTKDSNVVVTPTPTPNTTPAFRVEGVTDLRYNKTPFMPTNVLYEYLNVIYGNGSPQHVTLSFLNLPTGIQDSLTVRSGYPTFQSYAYLTLNNVANGNYTSKLVATPDSGTAQSYPFTISISGDTSCDGYLTSNAFTTTSSCLGTTSYQVTLSKNGRMGDTFYVDNFRNTGVSLMVLINCRNSTVTIPTQNIGNAQYSNNGSSISSSSSTNMIMLRTTEIDLTAGTYNTCNYSLSRN